LGSCKLLANDLAKPSSSAKQHAFKIIEASLIKQHSQNILLQRGYSPDRMLATILARYSNIFLRILETSFSKKRNVVSRGQTAAFLHCFSALLSCLASILAQSDSGQRESSSNPASGLPENKTRL